MPNVPVTISYALPSRSASSGLLLEQEPWGGKSRVTKLDLVKALDSALYGTENDNEIDCGVDGDGAYNGYLNAYPYDPALSYDIGVTHGELGECVIQEVEVRELISFSLETEASIKYPAQEITSYEWAAETWDAEGGVASDPAISVSGQTVTISAARYGTVVVVYKTIRHSRALTVPPRDDAVEGVFDSYGWARWNGGVELLQLDPPDGAEDDYFNETDCLFGGGLSILPDDPVEPPTEGSQDSFKLVDYCSQKEIYT